jgi:hypothetical protein
VSKREFKRKICTFQCCWPNEKSRKREGEFLHRETGKGRREDAVRESKGKHLLLQ